MRPTRSVVLAVSCIFAASAVTANTLTYEYIGNPLSLNEESTLEYLDAASETFFSSFAEEDVRNAFENPILPPLEFSFSVDQDMLGTGSVRGLTLDFFVTANDVKSVDVRSPLTSFSTASDGATVTFDDSGQVVGYSIFLFFDSGGIFLDSVGGDLTQDDPATIFGGAEAPGYITYEAPAGRFELVSGDVAPIPLPASLPLLAVAIGMIFMPVRRFADHQPRRVGANLPARVLTPG